MKGNSMEAFAPVDGGTVNIDVSGSTQRVLVSTGGNGCLLPVRIMNNGTATVWLRAGTVAVDAAVTDLPVGPGVTEVMRFRTPTAGSLYIAAIAAGATGKVYFTPGVGI